MSPMIRCAHCGRVFEGNPRVKNQRYCDEKDCQRARKREWQKNKLATDADYKANQRDCQIEWHKRNPDFYKEYRLKHSLYRKRNSLLQRCRNTKARAIATMDALELDPVSKPQIFYLLPLVATMDVSAQKVLLFSMRYREQGLIAKEDSIASRLDTC
ncbi:MAG: hypothetical protein P4L55_14205 [Syntrophobacteraceae bacterium]|nr:hypothetical protein [Syntrophobacteraceae bacterium]